MKEVKSGENQVGYLQNPSHCQPRLKPQVSSLAIQGTPAAAFPNPCPYHLGIPQTISSSYLPSLVALTQTPVPAGTLTNSRVAAPRVRRRLKANLHPSYFSSDSIPSVSFTALQQETCCGFPLLSDLIPQRSQRSFLPTGSIHLLHPRHTPQHQR